MCMEDVRISRSCKVNVHTVQAGGDAFAYLPANPWRIALWAYDQFNAVQLAIPGPTGPVFIPCPQALVNGTPGVYITAATHPGIVQGRIAVSTGGADTVVTWIESELGPPFDGRLTEK